MSGVVSFAAGDPDRRLDLVINVSSAGRGVTFAPYVFGIGPG